jgi:hypothetical protein
MRNARFSFVRAPSVAGSLVVAGGVWLAMAAGGTLRAGESSPLPTSLGVTQTVYLDYRELGQSVNNWNLSLGTQSAAFKKEPNLGMRKVVRGTMKFGNSADQFLPFLWDQTNGKLYLDLNRNQDLTDDPAGVFSCSEPVRYSNYYQTFTNVHLSFKAPGGSHRLLVDLHLYNYNQPNASVASRSYWAGKVSLHGRDWQLGIIEDASAKPGSAEGGYLLLRPWAARDQGFNLQDGSLDGFHFSRDLFLGGEAYRLDCAYVQQEGTPRYQIDLRPRQAELGELKLPGKFIKRLVLTGTKFTAVLDQPEPAVKVPVGSYHQVQVQLAQGGVEAYRESSRYGGSYGNNGTTITATKPAVLTVGGPLTNSVTVNRHGRALNLNYQLLGAGGETYQLLGARRQPEFAAYRGDKKIASGKFEFG